MRSLLLQCLAMAGVLACSATRAHVPAPSSGATVPPPPDGARGLILAPGAGERLEYCARPLTLTLKIDSLAAPFTQLVAGTGSIRGDEGLARHRTAHEIVFVRSGWGHAVFGADTQPLGPGSVVHVPPGTGHRFVRTGTAPLEYFWVLGPAASASGMRRAAMVGCAGGPATSASSGSLPDSGRAFVVAPGDGERITYCDMPLTITAKVDSENVSGTWLRAAAGSLRRGSEDGVHRVDEVVLITHGRGKAYAGQDTAAVDAGSVVYNPRGMRHGFINESNEPLEYFIVYADSRSRQAFRRRAAVPGPWCPPLVSPSR